MRPGPGDCQREGTKKTLEEAFQVKTPWKASRNQLRSEMGARLKAAAWGYKAWLLVLAEASLVFGVPFAKGGR